MAFIRNSRIETDSLIESRISSFVHKSLTIYRKINVIFPKTVSHLFALENENCK